MTGEKDEKYIPYVRNRKVTVLYVRNGFAIPSNFNDTHKFPSLHECKAFCEYQNSQLKREDSDEM